jgi:hypothetical protein
MRLISVETTPNPNSMKLNFDQSLGKPATYSRQQSAECPEIVAKLLEIADLQSVFVCGDFITLNKDPRADWRRILESAVQAVSDEGAHEAKLIPLPLPSSAPPAEEQRLAQVFVQTFKGVPIQVKVVDQEGESRVSLGARFNEAAQSIQEKTGADYLAERYWADYGYREGPSRDQIADEVMHEVIATFDAPDSASSSENISSLVEQLKDPNPKVRRHAAAGLGASGNLDAIPVLCEALLKDNSVAVRRTAGDALSDIGDPSAQPSVCLALKDTNKLVRWRAARFLAEVGNEDALPFLEEAANDPEFEVQLEIKAALERIRGGSEGSGPAWKRIIEG